MSGGWAVPAGFTSIDDFGGVNGTAVAPSATINTLGSWVLLGTLKTDCCAFKLAIAYVNNGQSDYACQIDIGVGPSGSQVAVINGINMNCKPAGLGQAIGFEHIIPLAIPGQTQIWARTAINRASFTGSIRLQLTPFSAAFNAPEFSGVETLGFLGPGRGRVVTPGANATGVKGSYASIGTITRDWAGFFLCCDLTNGAGSESGNVFDFAIGASGSQQIIMPDLFIYLGGVESPADFEFVGMEIPAGTQIWCRSAATNQNNVGVTLYGVYR